MIWFIIFLGVYIVGFFVSLHMLHKYKEDLDVDCYDPPHDGWYDDYPSNAHAYLAFSFMWPIFWFVMGIQAFWKLMVNLSENIGRKFK